MAPQQKPSNEELIHQLQERLEAIDKRKENEFYAIENDNDTLEDIMDIDLDDQNRNNNMEHKVNILSKKLSKFENGRKNNLIFYGVKDEKQETPQILMQKVKSIMKGIYAPSRDFSIVQAVRIYTAPDTWASRFVRTLSAEVAGCRPALVKFENLREKEEIFKNEDIFRENKIYMTQDMSRRVRESQAALQKFMQTVKRNNPSATCFLQLNKLHIDQKVYVLELKLDFIVTAIYAFNDLEDGWSDKLIDTPRPESVMAVEVNPEERIKELEEALKRQKEESEKALQEALRKQKEESEREMREAIKKQKEEHERNVKEALRKQQEESQNALKEALRKQKEQSDALLQEALKKQREEKEESDLRVKNMEDKMATMMKKMELLDSIETENEVLMREG